MRNLKALIEEALYKASHCNDPVVKKKANTLAEDAYQMKKINQFYSRTLAEDALYLIRKCSQEVERTISGLFPFRLINSAGEPLISWSMIGKSHQAWTPSPTKITGKNKLNNEKIEKSSTVANFVQTPTSVSFASTTVGSTINSEELIVPAGGAVSYAFSFAGDVNKVTFALKCYNSTHTYIGDANKIYDETSRAIMTTTSNTAFVRLVITSTVQGNVSLTNLMLNEGGTIMDFEPFTVEEESGPVDVKGVGDKIENIIPIEDKSTTTTAGITYSISNGEIIANGTTTSPFTTYIYRDAEGLSFDYDVMISKAEISNLSCNFAVVNNQGVKQWRNTNNTQLIAKGEKLFEVYLQQNNVGRVVNCKWKVELSPVYKIPMTSKAGEQEITTPIYLNSSLMAEEVLDSTGNKEVKWNSMVLTGNENYSIRADGRWYIDITGYEGEVVLDTYCTHYTTNNDKSLTPLDRWNEHINVKNRLVMYKNAAWSALRLSVNGNIASGAVIDFIKSEYEKGTPITVYYSLITPTSETVEVPEIPTFDGTTTISVGTEVQPSNGTITYKLK